MPDPQIEKNKQLLVYDANQHDYSVDTPSFREITPGHFVYCNDAEEKKYKQSVK